jgi:hypothetical protein
MPVAYLSRPTVAHMFLALPKPIEGSAPKDPLHADGSDFPCHGVSLPKTGGQKLVAGSSFQMEFDIGISGSNNAVHGGGSCQLAITYETEDARNPDVWRVIFSIEGGCPANTAGNLSPRAVSCESDQQADCVHGWNIPLPQGLTSGHAILSWTWFNAVGNREMYQNCVDVDIVNGTGRQMDSLPALYIANINGEEGCISAPESYNLAFPSPGSMVTTMSATSHSEWPFTTPSCRGELTDVSFNSISESSASASVFALPSQASGDTSIMASGHTNQQEVPNGAGATVATRPEVSDEKPCSMEGGLVCIDEYHFGVCESGHVLTSPLPWGTVCMNGVVTGLGRAPESILTALQDDTQAGCRTGVPCYAHGSLICIGAREFGICDRGCAVAQPVAEGTVCVSGAIKGTK